MSARPKPVARPARKEQAHHIAAAMRAVAESTDADQLRRIMVNARAQNANGVYDAAFARRIVILSDGEPGSVENDFWRTVLACEQIMSEAQGKTIRATRTRQKVQRVGVTRTLEEWAAADAPTEGFGLLIERAFPELTGEAIVLRHPEHFTEEARAAARTRLEAAGVDTAALPPALVPQE